MTKPFKLETDPEPQFVEANQEFDYKAYIGFVRRHWLLMVSAVLLALVGAQIYLVGMVPVFSATSQILLDPRKERISGAEKIYSDVSFDISFMESQIALMRSDDLLARVVKADAVAFPPGPRPEPVIPPLVLSLSALLPPVAPWLKQMFAVEAPWSPPVDINNPASVQGAVDGLRNSLQITRTGQSLVIAISVFSTDPQKATRLANAVAEAYAVDKLDARYASARRASEWLNDRLVDLGQQLRKSEDAVAQFRAKTGLLGSVAGGPSQFTQQQMTELNAKVVAARSEVAEKKLRLSVLEDALKNGSAADLSNIFASPEVAALKVRVSQAKQREAELRFRYTERHPALISAAAETRDAERALSVEIKKQVDAVRTDYELAVAKLAAAEKSFTDASSRGSEDEQTAVTLRELERAAAVNKSLFEDFLQRAKLTDEQATFEVREARTIVGAQPSSMPVSPNRNRIFAVAVLLGLAIWFAIAYALDRLKTGFTTAQQVENTLGLPVLGSLPRISGRERRASGKSLSLPLLPLHKPLSRFSETMRTLRSGLQLSDVDRPPKIVQVASSRPSEGKTTIALSIASSAAMAGHKVLILDCDLRRRSATHYFKAEKERGLVDYLASSESEDAFICHDVELDVDYLPAGSKSTSPPDLLQSDKLKTLLSKLRARYDYIVIDSPPVGPIVDAKILSLLADKVLFVVRWDATAREVAASAVAQLKTPRKMAGVVLNLVNENRARRYGRQAYHYTYGDAYYGE